MSAPNYDHDGRMTAEHAARWLSDQAAGRRNPLRDPGMGGPTQQFGDRRPVPHDRVPLVETALYERGKTILTKALGHGLADVGEEIEHLARCREAYAVPEVAAMHAYCYGLRLGAEDGRRQGEDERLRLRGCVLAQNREIARLHARLTRSWPERLLALWAALAGRVAR